MSQDLQMMDKLSHLHDTKKINEIKCTLKNFKGKENDIDKSVVIFKKERHSKWYLQHWQILFLESKITVLDSHKTNTLNQSLFMLGNKDSKGVKLKWFQ